MTILIHGEDVSASRKCFLDFLKNTKDPLILEGEQVILQDLAQALQSSGLFQDSKSIFIDQLLRKKNKDEVSALLSFIMHNASEHTVYIWENRKVDAALLKLFKQSSIREFKLPQTLFSFLDSIKPGDSQRLLLLFHTALETMEVEILFYMLVRHFRIMLSLFEQSDEKIDEIKRLADWQKSKLVIQSRLFGRDQLINQYARLFDLEMRQKTGSLPVSLVVAIDFFLIEL